MKENNNNQRKKQKKNKTKKKQNEEGQNEGRRKTKKNQKEKENKQEKEESRPARCSKSIIRLHCKAIVPHIKRNFTFEASPIFSKEFEYIESWEQQEPSETMQAREQNRKDPCNLSEKISCLLRKHVAFRSRLQVKADQVFPLRKSGWKGCLQLSRSLYLEKEKKSLHLHLLQLQSENSSFLLW